MPIFPKKQLQRRWLKPLTMPSDNPEKLEQRAKNILLHQLSRSMKSRHQLAEVLKKREIPDEIALRVLTRFEEAQLIDDKVFSEAFVRSRISAGKAASVIRRELKTRGIAEALIQQSTAQISTEQEAELAEELAAHRYVRMVNLEPEVAKRRLLGFLLRRGFSQQLAYQAVRKAMAAR